MALSCAWGQAAVGVGVHRSLGNLPLLRQLRGLWPRGSHLDSPGLSLHFHLLHETPHTGAAARENPRDATVISR